MTAILKNKIRSLLLSSNPDLIKQQAQSYFSEFQSYGMFVPYIQSGELSIPLYISNINPLDIQGTLVYVDDKVFRELFNMLTTAPQAIETALKSSSTTSNTKYLDKIAGMDVPTYLHTVGTLKLHIENLMKTHYVFTSNLSFPFLYDSGVVAIPKKVNISSFALESVSVPAGVGYRYSQSSTSAKNSSYNVNITGRTVVKNTEGIDPLIKGLIKAKNSSGSTGMPSALAEFKPKYQNFNFLIQIVHNYTKYQTTGAVFGNAEIKKAVLSGNILRALELQTSLLVPANNLGGHTGLNAFLWLTTMGYIKSGQVITSTMSKFFNDDGDRGWFATFQRIFAMGINVRSMQDFSPPVFVTEVIGTDYTPEGLPSGKMVCNLITECLIEADAIYKLIQPSGRA